MASTVVFPLHYQWDATGSPGSGQANWGSVNGQPGGGNPDSLILSAEDAAGNDVSELLAQFLEGDCFILVYDDSQGPGNCWLQLAGANVSFGDPVTIQTGGFYSGNWSPSEGDDVYVTFVTSPAHIAYASIGASAGLQYFDGQMFQIDQSGILPDGGGSLNFQNMPTSDPHNAGSLWNNNGVVNVSAG